jgi:hypothetical protein
MSDGRVPSPDFDGSRYERPNKDWICGHTCDGCPCRIGPSPSGQCRATTECFPELELRSLEAKGTWKCTRPKEWGGPCPEGPQPDGTCCRAIPKCQPQRSLRNRRGLVTRAVLAATAALLLIGLGLPVRDTLLNPAPLSRQHSGRDFARLAEPHGGGQGCVLCHTEINGGLGAIAQSAVAASKGSLHFSNLTEPHPKDFSRIDQSCVNCHRAQSFHQASVVRDTSCSVCHQEHQGNNGLLPVAAENCTACHGDQREMVASGLKSRSLPPGLFAPKLAAGVIAHPVARPSEGYTRVIKSFILDHPEFQPLRDPSRDPNPLKFNHRIHLEGDIPPVNGKKLDCASCHQPDATRAFMQRITFEQNCRACHSLNFDENNPGMTLPHGDATQVRAYLRSLPTQYADFAARERGLTRQEDIRAFVERQIGNLRTRTLSGENLERAVFFADAATGEATTIAGVTGPARAKFAGCAYCHEVTPRGEAAPAITPPRTPDRWLLHGRFSHARHETVACTQCHAAGQSTKTSDVILPTQKSCTECHSPQGGVTFDCSACHTYHTEPPGGLSPALRSALRL